MTVRHKLGAPMARNMVGSIGEDTQEIPRPNIKIYTSSVCEFEGRNHDRNDALNGLTSDQSTAKFDDATI